MSERHEGIIRRTARKVVYKIPGAKALWQRWIFGKKGVHQFEGWGMTTEAVPPWRNPRDDTARDFLQVHEALVKEVLAGRFRLAQFDAVNDKEALLYSLMWRHYIVFWSARYAQTAMGNTLAECGVCDGLTVYFAMKALGKDHKAFLYDAWEGMDAQHLLENEHKHLGDYAYLDIEDTKKNLSTFNTIFIKGFIPESFAGAEKPTGVVWLHIDLNASLPTTDSLRYLFDQIPAGGVVLFDDYAGQAYTDTKKAVDTFFSNKKGILLPLPTGQAIFFKR
ncbi:MAG TPA: TylF/MycF/NovP-related O-methyltransferase [Candidatus Paceibacterota bacterium]|nr:TylF/MycF/NovP-related O-methyltransferase [Candidatus Paceibacterota bacterium]